MTRNDTVIGDVIAERARQDSEWGGPEHDDTHAPLEWVAILIKHVGKVADMALAADQRDAALDLIRPRFVKMAAICIAAIEAIDRKMRRCQHEADTLGRCKRCGAIRRETGGGVHWGWAR